MYQNPYQTYPYPWNGIAPAPTYQQTPTWLPQTTQQTNVTQPPQQQTTGAASLVGRTVRSAQEVTPQEVPMDGTLALFPLADGSAVIGKRWTTEGTISEVRFVPERPAKEEAPTFEASVLDRLDAIEDNLASLMTPAQQPKRQTRRVKETSDES